MHGGRRHGRDLDDELLDLAQLARRRLFAAGCARLLDAPQVQQLIDHETLFHFLGGRRRELVFWPDRPTTDLLAAGELGVRVPDDRRDLLAVPQEEHAVYLDVLARALQTDDRRDRRPEGRRDGFDARISGQGVLDVLRVHLRAVGEDDHVLLAAAQPQEAIVVVRTEVARVIPTVLVEDGARGLLVLPIALEDVGATREHLAVLGDLHLDARQRRADGAKAVQIDAVEGQGGGSLRRPVALEHVDAELPPGLAQRGVQRRAAGHDVTKTAAELTVDAEEQQTAERHRQTARHTTQLFEELLLALRLRGAFDR